MAAPPTPAPAKHPFLTRPLYVYDLPPALPDSLRLRSIDATDPAALLPPTADQQQPIPQTPASTSTTTATATPTDAPAPTTRANRVPPCTLCPSCHPFATASAQRAHFRSDWHRYNVHLNHRAAPLVDEPAFDKLCEEVDTAGETDTDEDTAAVAAAAESAKTRADTLTKLLQRLALGTGRSNSANRNGQADNDDEDDDEYGDDRSARSSVTARSPLLWFTSRDDADPQARMPQTQLGVYRGIFPDPGTALAPTIDSRLGAAEWYRACLSSMQAGRLTRKGGRNGGWTGKRLKAQGAQEAAKGVMMTVLDGEGYIPGLKLESGRDSSDEDDSDASTDSDDGFDSDLDDGATITTTTQTASSVISRGPDSSSRDPPLRLWTVMLMGGGHFAAAVIALNPHVVTVKGRKGNGPREERSILLLAHKTFHRYTTRRKQGGGQAAQDATGRFAKSAGAQLRRYNEAALGDDIRTLLDLPGWRELVGRSERIWIRAGARAAKGTLWNWEGAKAARASPLDAAKEEGRLESLPFPTRRPTIGETVRCFFELTRVKIERKTDEELLALDQAYRDSLSARSRKEAEAKQKEKASRDRAAEQEAKKQAAAAMPKLSEEEKARRARFERMVEMVRKGRLETLINFLGKNEGDLLRPSGWEAEVEGEVDDADDAAAKARRRIDARLPDWWLLEQVGSGGRGAAETKLVPCTLLQLAAEAGAEEIVRHLLVDRRADPTLPVDRAGAIRRRTQKSTDPIPGGEGSTHDIVAIDTLTSSTTTEDSVASHRTAYDLASNKETRNVFRKSMAEHAEWYDWGGMAEGGARVPSALTTEMEETQAAKTKDRRAALREKAKERAAVASSRSADATAEGGEGEVEPQQPSQSSGAVVERPSHGTTNRLGGTSATPRALRMQVDEAAGLTPEMRARIEREKRARAAEERFKKLQGGGAGGGAQ